MNKAFPFFVILFFSFLTCFGQQAEVQNGDLLFVGLPVDYASSSDSSMASAIIKATRNSDEINYIHVAILEVDENGAIWVIDATLKRGVDRHPLDTFLRDFTLRNGSLPTLDVKRLKNRRDIVNFVDNAKRFCGRSYDLFFLPDNEEKYCSELVRNSYIRNGKHLFSEAPMNFKSEDGTFPPYWVKLFQRINRPIPQDIPGTNPNAMFKEKILRYVGKLNPQAATTDRRQ